MTLFMVVFTLGKYGTENVKSERCSLVNKLHSFLCFPSKVRTVKTVSYGLMPVIHKSNFSKVVLDMEDLHGLTSHFMVILLNKLICPEISLL